MTARKRHRVRYGYPGDVMMRLEQFGRVGWAKWYEECRHSDQLASMNHVLMERIETLIPELLDLTDDVLFSRNPVAFAKAYRIRRLITDYQAGRRDIA